jgi:hypothetical protein
MFRLNKVYVPYRVKCEFKSSIPETPHDTGNDTQPYAQITHQKKDDDDDEIMYLPGEKLLLKLNKQKRKLKLKQTEKYSKKNNLKGSDIDRLSQRMTQILKEF